MQKRDVIAAAIVLVVMGGGLGAYEYTSRYATTKRPTCQNKVLQSLLAPNKNVKAIQFERDCGTGANLSAQVSILPAAGTLANEPGNVFIADLQSGKRPAVTMAWQSPDGLEIVVIDPYARVYKKTDFVGDIVVTFREGP